MARGRAWPPEDVERGLLALVEAGDNAEQASRQTGIPANTLRGWRDRYDEEFVEVRREKRSELINDIWAAATEALGELRASFARMKGKDLAVTLGILIDKALVMGGEPTEISETKIKDVRANLESKLRKTAIIGAEEEVPVEPHE